MSNSWKNTISTRLRNAWRRHMRRHDKNTYTSTSITACWDCHWRVQYLDGKFSRKFCYDTACDYRDIFGGQVVYVRYKDPA